MINVYLFCKSEHTMTDDNLLYDAIPDTGTLTDDQWTSIENWILKTEGTPDPFTEAQVQYQNQVSLVKPGETTLMKAIRQNAPLTVIQALLKIGDKDLLNKRDGAGNTALMKAIERGASPVVIHALLNIGGKELLNMRNTTNGSNKNALDLAYERGPSAATLFENLAAVYVYMQILHVTDIKTVEQTFQAKFYLKASWVQKRTDLFRPDPAVAAAANAVADAAADAAAITDAAATVDAAAAAVAAAATTAANNAATTSPAAAVAATTSAAARAVADAANDAVAAAKAKADPVAAAEAVVAAAVAAAKAVAVHDIPIVPADWDPDHHPWPIGVRYPNLGFDNAIDEIELTSQHLNISNWRYVPTGTGEDKVPFSKQNVISPLVVVEWNARATGTFRHPFDLYDYPVDKQVLKITMSSLNFGTYLYDDNYNGTKSTIRTDYYMDEGFQFDLHNGNGVGNKLELDESIVTINQRSFSNLSYKIPIKRSSQINRELLIPIALISFGSFASFIFAADDVSNRLSVSITIFLVMTAYSYLKSSYLPRIEDPIDVTSYIFWSFVLIFAVVAENAVMSVILCKGWCKDGKDYSSKIDFKEFWVGYEETCIGADFVVFIALLAMWFYLNLGLFLLKPLCFTGKCSKCSPFCNTRTTNSSLLPR